MTTTMNHINLATTNPAELAPFFERVCGFRRVDERGGGKLILLESAGFILTLMADSSLEDHRYPKNFHIGFLQPDRESVLSFYSRGQELGYVCDPPGVVRRNTFGFYLVLQDSIQVEVSTFANP